MAAPAVESSAAILMVHARSKAGEPCTAVGRNRISRPRRRAWSRARAARRGAAIEKSAILEVQSSGPECKNSSKLLFPHRLHTGPVLSKPSD